MSIDFDDTEKLLPDQLSKTGKGRLQLFLSQFKTLNNFSEYYDDNDYSSFLQGDVINDVYTCSMNSDKTVHGPGYRPAIIISNSCDISAENERKYINKNCLMAPVEDLDTHRSMLLRGQSEDKSVDDLIKLIKQQQKTNLLYLPPASDTGVEYIAILDKIFSHPPELLNEMLPHNKALRISSLSQAGHYLFLCKLSFHICRIPEAPDRTFRK
ncbi:MAG: hypothetical protein IPI60_13630 [Saprospiraceae bacterium]|nr:hypothetical protein [Saprospiraceae bacterium]